MNKELKKIVAALEAQGFTTYKLASGHTAVRKEGEWVTSFAGSPSKSSGYRNGLATCKRFGFQWPP